MARQNEEKSANSSNLLVFTLATASIFHEESQALAEKLHKDRSIYYFYAGVDSASSSCSMFKYYCDLFASNNTPDGMHDMMQTAGGTVGISIEAIFLIGFSVLACHFEDEEDPLKKEIATYWPYFRDVIKGLKNAHKGWRSFLQALSFFSGTNLLFLVVPVGLGLGVLAAMNRVWLRQMVDKRKKMMDANDELIKDIKSQVFLREEERKSYLKRLQFQTNEERMKAFFGVSFGGLVDGLYLYVGVLGLAIISNPAFIAMVVLCSIYTVGCILSRLYEEFDFQQRLLITHTKCHLALNAIELNTSFSLLLQALIDQDAEQVDALKTEVFDLINEFEKHRLQYIEHSTRSYLTATLLGIKNGLFAYGALTSILFLLSSILLMASATFPPALLIFAVSTGIVFILGFVAYGLSSKYLHGKKVASDAERPYNLLLQMKDKLDDDNQAEQLLQIQDFRAAITDGLSFKSTPQLYFQEWFEVIRSFFSGIAKGQKFADFAGNSFQEVGADGHYHDTKFMYVIALANAIFFAIVLALRALTRGFGKPPRKQSKIDDIELKDLKTTHELSSSDELEEESDLEIEKAPLNKDLDSDSSFIDDNQNGSLSLHDPEMESGQLTLGAWRANTPPPGIGRPLSSQSIFKPLSIPSPPAQIPMHRSGSTPSFKEPTGVNHSSLSIIPGLD